MFDERNRLLPDGLYHGRSATMEDFAAVLAAMPPHHYRWGPAMTALHRRWAAEVLPPYTEYVRLRAEALAADGPDWPKIV